MKEIPIRLKRYSFEMNLFRRMPMDISFCCFFLFVLFLALLAEN